MNNFCVYEHVFPNGKRYIGMTKNNPTYRWGKGSGYKTQTVYRAINKYGWDNIQHNIVFKDITYEDACLKEKYLIKKYKTTNPMFGYNNTSGGDAKKEMSLQTKQRMSKAQKGRPCSEKTKRINRERLLGKPRDRDAVEKTSKKLKGRKIGMTEYRRKRMKEGMANMSPEKKKLWIQHIQEAKIRNKTLNNPHNGKQVLQLDKSTGEIVHSYNSLNEMQRKTGFDRKYIGQICNGLYKKDTDIAYGFRWKFGDLRNYKDIRHYKGR